MMVMALGETYSNNDGGYHQVLSQNEKEFVYKELNFLIL
jgi:hypothetical protein